MELIGNKKALIGTGIFMGVMYVIVMLIVNPLIDGNMGFEVIGLQLSFSIESGLSIIENWGEIGQLNFLKYIFTDYIYALSYALFLASLYAYYVVKNRIEISSSVKFIVLLPFFAAGLDMIENTIEIFFINNPDGFLPALFMFHSVVAMLKWSGVPLMIYFIVKVARDKTNIITLED